MKLCKSMEFLTNIKVDFYTFFTMRSDAKAQPLFSCCTYFSYCECQSESLLVYCNVKHLLLIQISSLHFFFVRQCAIRRCVCASIQIHISKLIVVSCRNRFKIWLNEKWGMFLGRQRNSWDCCHVKLTNKIYSPLSIYFAGRAK